MSHVRDHGEICCDGVSSHALDLGRVREIDYDVALFTNLTQDHLDYHKDLESYCDAKLKLFDKLPVEPGRFSVITPMILMLIGFYRPVMERRLLMESTIRQP